MQPTQSSFIANHSIRFGTSFQQTVNTFIDQHADAFEAFNRMGSPFGGSCLPRSARLTQPESAFVQRESVHSQLDTLQHTVSLLAQQIQQLQSVLAQAGQTPGHESGQRSQSRLPEVGIRRFWALQARSSF